MQQCLTFYSSPGISNCHCQQRDRSACATVFYVLQQSRNLQLSLSTKRQISTCNSVLHSTAVQESPTVTVNKEADQHVQQCFTFYSSPGISNCHCQQRDRSACATVFYVLQQSRNLQLSLSTKRQIGTCNSVLHSTAVQESPTVTVNKEADQHVQQCFTFYSSPGISNCHCQQRGRSARATVFYVLQQSRNLQLSLSTERQISMCNSVLHSTAVQKSPTVTVNKETDQHVQQCFTFYSSPEISNCHCQQRGRSACATVVYILQQSRNLQLSLSTKRQISTCNSVLHSTAVQESPTVTVNKEGDQHVQQCFTFYSSPGISNCHCQQRGRSACATVFYVLQQSKNLQLSLSTKRQISTCNSVLHSTAVQESLSVTVNKETDQHVKQCFTFYSSSGISNCHCQQRGRSACATVFYILQQSRNLQLSLSTKRQISTCNSVLHSTAVQESPTVTVNKETDQHVQQCFTFYSSPGISNCHCQERGRSACATVFYVLQQSRNLQLSLSTKRQISTCNSVLRSAAVQESPTVTVNKETDQHVQQCFTFYSSQGISNCHCQQRDRSACATVFYVLQQSRNLQLSLSTKRQSSMCNSVLHSTAVQESPTVTVNKETDQHVQQCFTFYSSPGISNCHCQQRGRAACATVFYILQQSRNLQLSLSTKRQISTCNSVLHSTAVQESPTVTVNKEADQHVQQFFTFYSSPGISNCHCQQRGRSACATVFYVLQQSRNLQLSLSTKRQISMCNSVLHSTAVQESPTFTVNKETDQHVQQCFTFYSSPGISNCHCQQRGRSA